MVIIPVPGNGITISRGKRMVSKLAVGLWWVGARTAAAFPISLFPCPHILLLQEPGKCTAIGLSQRLDKSFTKCSCKRDFQGPVRIASIKGKLHVISKTLQMFL